MARKKSRGGTSNTSLYKVPIMLQVFGAIMMLVCLIGFNIVLGQIDTAYTNAASYTEQVGLSDIMGIVPMIFFIAFMSVGVGAITASGVVSFMQARTLDPMAVIMAIINSVIAAVVAFILWNVILTNLHTSYTTAQATTNIAYFSGLLNVMGIWGIVILTALVGSALAGLGGIAWGGYKRIKG